MNHGTHSELARTPVRDAEPFADFEPAGDLPDLSLEHLQHASDRYAAILAVREPSAGFHDAMTTDEHAVSFPLAATDGATDALGGVAPVLAPRL